MPAPDQRLVCCLCSQPISKSSAVYVLDSEWQRRFPRMAGTLACGDCALHKTYWSCRNPDGSFVTDHRRAIGKPEERDHDSWDHVDGGGTANHMASLYPSSALLQGAEE